MVSKTNFLCLIVAALAYVTYVSSDACVQCNSGNDPTCATNPQRFFAKECANASSKCYSRVLDGTTIRGCASDLDNKTLNACSNEMECLICTFMEGCNRNIFPTHRAQCRQCTGNGTGICATDTFASPKVCPIYKLGDKCFIRKTNNTCVQCNSTSDPKCATNPEQFLATVCTNTSSKCYARVLDGATIRGCASDLDNQTLTTCSNEMECLVCTFIERCNLNVFPTHRTQCLECSGNATGICAEDTFAKPKVCAIYKLGDKCFIRKTNNPNNTDSFMRGCLSSAQASKLCVSDDCYTCEGTGCNYLTADSKDIPFAKGAAPIISYSMFLMFACTIFRLMF